MKVALLLEKRRRNWQELESLCARLGTLTKGNVGAADVSRFAALYRAACADLALADAYQLPPNTVQYLHRLVGQAHNQLYRTRALDVAAVAKMLLVDAPQRIFNDRCVQLMFVLFWGTFILSAWLAYSTTVWPGYAEQLMTSQAIEQMEEMHGQPWDKRGDPGEGRAPMAAFYIQHNTGIGLRCFACGLLVVPGLCETIFNAAFLGAAFGHMARPDVEAGKYFFQFVTAHGPFELTAIVLSAGAGLRLGISWINPGDMTRMSSLRKTALEALPIMAAAVVLFCGAAFIEGFISPSYWTVPAGLEFLGPVPIKTAIAVVTSGLLMFYFVILGFPRRPLRAHG
jgi:uncharacterized membrane protein SpoIIM required for sporulation